MISQSEISLVVKLAFLRANGMAIEGATVNFFGCVAASAIDTILASGLSPLASTNDSVASTKAEAPSFSVEALAAVTVPSRIMLIIQKLYHP